MVLSIRSAQKLAATLLKQVGIESFLLDAQLILGVVTKKERFFVQLDSEQILTKNEEDQFFSLLARRLCFEPMAYIIGAKEFFGATFLVSKDCLIPRPDTEIVVEECLKLIDGPQTIFDLCTGSGAIAISILLNREQAQVIASDLSEKALKVAELNALRLGVSSRLKLLKGDLFEPFLGKKAQLIVINPPYISPEEIKKLAPDVREHEPLMALDGGKEGLDFYKRIFANVDKYLYEKGFLVLEIGFDQSLALERLVDEKVWTKKIFKDLAGNDRGIVLQKR